MDRWFVRTLDAFWQKFADDRYRLQPPVVTNYYVENVRPPFIAKWDKQQTETTTTQCNIQYCSIDGEDITLVVVRRSRRRQVPRYLAGFLRKVKLDRNRQAERGNLSPVLASMVSVVKFECTSIRGRFTWLYLYINYND